MHHGQGGQGAEEPDAEGGNLQNHEAFPFVGVGTDVALVAIAQEESGGAVDGAGKSGLRGGEDGGQHQAGQADRQLRDNEMGENGVRFSGGAHGVGQQFRAGSVESEQRGPDEKEQGGNWQIKQGATPYAAGGVPVRPGRLVTLHVTLVDAEVLEVHEDAVDQDDPEGGFGPECGVRQIEGQAAETELVVFGGDLEDLAGSGGHAEEEDGDAGECAADEDEALDDVGPDHGLHAADEGIGNHQHAGDEDQGDHAPADER